MSLIRNQLNNSLSTIRNYGGVISFQTRNHTERKPNLRKPKEPDFKKKLLLTLIEPFYAKDKRTDAEKCIEWKKTRTYEPHPYIRMLADDCVKDLKSNYIYLFHLNSISDHNFNLLRKEFLKKNIYLRKYPIEVIKLSIENSRLSNLYQFFRHYGCFAISPDMKLDDVIKLCKSNDRITLMGGVFDNRILNLKQMEEYKQLGNIDTVRAQLCNILSTHSIQLSSTLDYHTRDLVHNLTNYVDKKPTDSANETSKD